MLSVLSSLHIPIFLSKIVQFKTLLFFLLLTLTDVSTTCAIVIFRVKENDCDSEDWPRTTRVVKMSDIVNNSPIQDYVLYPDDHAQPT